MRPRVYDHVDNNISWDFHMDFGDVEKAFNESDLVREDRFQTGRVITGYLEPPAAVAVWDSSGITIWAAKQSPYFVYRHLAACFNLPLSKVRIIQPFIGGGFGGTKNDSLVGDFCVCLFSKMTGKPVKFVYNMEEVLMTCRRRHNMIVHNKMGMKKDGTITGMHSRVIADGGGHTAIGPLTMYLTGCMSTLPYKLPNFKHDAYRVFTNNPISAAMRGHGVTHTRFAAEIQMEMMAEELGLDPVEVRLRNAITAPHETINKVTVQSCGLREGIELLADTPNWKERDSKKANGWACIPRGWDFRDVLSEWCETEGPSVLRSHCEALRRRNRGLFDRRHGLWPGFRHGVSPDHRRGTGPENRRRGNQEGGHRSDTL